MKNAKIHSILSEIAEKAAPSAEIDLWQGLRRRLDTSESRFHQGETLMKTNLPRTLALRAAPALLAAVIVLSALLATPPGRAFAQSVWRFFTATQFPHWFNPNEAQLITDSPSVANTQAGFYETCGSHETPSCTVQQVRELAGFDVKGPSILPDGMYFAGATGRPSNVFLLYENGTDGALLINVEPWNEQSSQASEVGDSATVETVSILSPTGTLEGEYVIGTWSGPAFSEWDASPDMQTLIWRDGDTIYRMVSAGQNTFEGQLLDKDSMALVAGSMTSDPLVLAIAPQTSAPRPVSTEPKKPDFYYALTVGQVEDQAGFEVIEPAWLPADYRFNHATYAPENGNVCLFYSHAQKLGDSPALIVIQNVSGALPDIETWTLWSYQIWGTQPPPFETTTSALPLNGAAGGQATKSVAGQNPNYLCGGHGSIQGQTLMWTTPAGRTFIIQSNKGPLSPFLTTLETRRLAESLNGVSPLAGEQNDPERLPDLQAAEALWGSQFPIPGETSGLAFSHAQVDETSRTLTLVYDYLVITIQAGSAESIESVMARELEFRYEQVTVNNVAAVYQQGCFWVDSGELDWNCPYGPRILTWFENGTKYQVTSNYPADLSMETLVAIAESIR